MTSLPPRPQIPRIGSFKTVAAFKQHLARLPIPVDCDDAVQSGPGSPLAQLLAVAGLRIGNRFAVQPMEGWDGTPEGKPSPLTVRRWRAFGESGAKLIWGGEAVAVRPDGRANPNQLAYTEGNARALGGLLAALRQAHAGRFGTADDLVAGLQLTHSGRFCRPAPDWGLQPRIAYRHPLLDAQVGVRDDGALLTDLELGELTGAYVAAARCAREAGFQFVDIKHCHGYLLHEFLTAHTRPGPYGGSFENRTRLLREIVAAIRVDAPGLHIGVRLSAFDFVPFAKPEAAGAAGVPVPHGHLLPYRYAFGANPDRPVEVDLAEPVAFLELCRALQIPFVNLTAGSPYTTPHIQRPALFPPSDGYLPPEDPLTGCARQLQVAAALKRAVPELTVVGTGYTYFQDFLPHVAQAQVRLGRVDLVGLGRMMLSYPHFAADVLAGRALERGRVCRTFSDCTSAPRNRLVSGCYPLDPFYKERPEARRLKAAKKETA
jgi:2,4-dienoyl-CoA reductase-like NADH-dependent reductase (Old Yellow Enzyme family)